MTMQEGEAGQEQGPHIYAASVGHGQGPAGDTLRSHGEDLGTGMSHLRGAGQGHGEKGRKGATGQGLQLLLETGITHTVGGKARLLLS